MIEYKWFGAGVIDASFRDLRIQVFVNEQGFPENIEFDDYDKTVPHLAVFSDGTPVATGRIVEIDKSTCKIGRIAVKKEMRGTGLGEKTVLELLRRAKESGYVKAIVGAQTHAVGFYEKCGFIPVGTDEYFEEHVSHLDMYQLL